MEASCLLSWSGRETFQGIRDFQERVKDMESRVPKELGWEVTAPSQLQSTSLLDNDLCSLHTQKSTFKCIFTWFCGMKIVFIFRRSCRHISNSSVNMWHLNAASQNHGSLKAFLKTYRTVAKNRTSHLLNYLLHQNTWRKINWKSWFLPRVQQGTAMTTGSRVWKVTNLSWN